MAARRMTARCAGVSRICRPCAASRSREPRRLVARVVLAPDAPADVAGTVRARLAVAIEDAGAVAPAVDVVEVDGLERDPGPAAKVKLVIDRG